MLERTFKFEAADRFAKLIEILMRGHIITDKKGQQFKLFFPQEKLSTVKPTRLSKGLHLHTFISTYDDENLLQEASWQKVFKGDLTLDELVTYFLRGFDEQTMLKIIDDFNKQTTKDIPRTF